MLEKLWLLKRLERAGAWKHIYVMLFVTLGFVLFDGADVREALGTMAAMFGAGEYPLATAEAVYCLKSFGPMLLLAAIGSTPLPARLWAGAEERWGRAMAAAQPAALMLLLILCTAYLADGSFNPFLYFRF